MSKLRPELGNADPGSYCPRGATAYYEVLGAVEGQPGLIHGQLDGVRGAHCAMGSYFDARKGRAFPTELVDEIAAVNDSVPKATPAVRKQFVLRWLRWKLGTLGFPYRTKRPKA